MTEEKLLIEKASQGDKECFEKIINLYKNYIFAIILNFIKDNKEAENMAQEVFLQIFISLPKFQEDNFKGWISRIASNKSIDYMRKKRSRVKEVGIEDLEIIDIINKNKDRNNPETIFIKKESSQKTKKEIEALPRIYKDTIRKFYLEEMTYEEIAIEQKVSKKTVESRLYRGRILLKENWRDEDESP